MNEPGSWEAVAARIGPAAATLALRQAEGDRALLARLRASGEVRRDPTVGAGVPGAAAFVRDIESRAFPGRNRGQDTIRPNPKNRRKKR